MIPRTQVVTPGSRNARPSCNSAVGGGRIAMVPVAPVGVILLRAVVCRRINFGTVLLRYGATCNPDDTREVSVWRSLQPLACCRMDLLGFLGPHRHLNHAWAVGHEQIAHRLRFFLAAVLNFRRVGAFIHQQQVALRGHFVSHLQLVQLRYCVSAGPRSPGGVSLSGQSTTSLKSEIGHFGWFSL